MQLSNIYWLNYGLSLRAKQQPEVTMKIPTKDQNMTVLATKKGDGCPILLGQTQGTFSISLAALSFSSLSFFKLSSIISLFIEQLHDLV